MKILWITNLLTPDGAEYLGVQTGASGTWLIDISRMLSQTEGVELAIACVHGNEYKKFTYKKVTYYLLPGTGKNMLFYTKAYESLWKKIVEDYKPDVVHIHGTEYSHGLAFLRSCPNEKSIISIQGMMARIKDVDFGEIPLKHFIFGRTLKQYLHMNGEIELHMLNKKNAKYEAEMINRVKYLNGFSAWDTALSKSINPKLKIYRLEYNMRESFYKSEKWDIDKIEKYSIFTNPAGVPLKGLHQLLRAVALVKNEYPAVKVYVPGMSAGNGKLAVTGAYSKYIMKLIKKHDLCDNVVFLGRLNEQEMAERMLKSHIFVTASAIEGCSLVLREALHLGLPAIASFRGGMADFISDKHDGFFFDFQEYPYLAMRIGELFGDPELCKKFSKNAIVKAEAAHDRDKNLREHLELYTEVMNDIERE